MQNMVLFWHQCVKWNVIKSPIGQLGGFHAYFKIIFLHHLLSGSKYKLKCDEFSFFSPLSSLQNSVAVFRELCGVSAVSNLMQCVLALGSRVSAPDGTPLLLFDLQDHYPTLEAQGPLPDVLRRVISTYETVRETLSWLSLRYHAFSPEICIFWEVRDANAEISASISAGSQWSGWSACYDTIHLSASACCFALWAWLDCGWPSSLVSLELWPNARWIAWPGRLSGAVVNNITPLCLDRWIDR